MVHVSNYFATPSQLELAERLKRITGAGDEGRVYFGNSGAEANEAAFKLARRTGRPRILALKNAFHGRTMGALALTGKPALQEPFLPMVPGVEHLDSTVDALEAAIGDDVAALIVEPIKGETGVVPLPEGYLRAARAITERDGALLIVDEIQTGVGRTGRWFDFQHEGIDARRGDDRQGHRAAACRSARWSPSAPRAACCSAATTAARSAATRSRPRSPTRCSRRSSAPT